MPVKKTKPSDTIPGTNTSKSIKVEPSKKSIARSPKSLLSTRVQTAEGIRREKMREKGLS